jgi:hypothetical protein
MESPAVGSLTYPAADLDPAHAKLTVRQREADSRATPPGLSFAFDGPNKIVITRPTGFDAGAIYELIYSAKDSKVMGLGFAATRDIVSFLRNEAAAIVKPIARISSQLSKGAVTSCRTLAHSRARDRRPGLTREGVK